MRQRIIYTNCFLLSSFRNLSQDGKKKKKKKEKKRKKGKKGKRRRKKEEKKKKKEGENQNTLQPQLS